ncbi:MAG: hypothetical protein ACTSRZ_07405 [Promethearchaeota archaeon]
MVVSSSSSEDILKARVICPKCQKSEYIEISRELLKRSGKGLTTILIPKDLICEHSFQIFVDRNGAVRGYETPDYELTFSPMEEEEEKTFEIGDKSILEVLFSILDEEIFYKTIRTIFLGGNVYCITDQKYLKENLKNFLQRIFGDYCTEIFVVNTKEYNEFYRKRVYASSEKLSFVFNMDINVIVKQIYKDTFFHKEKFNLEKSIFQKFLDKGTIIGKEDKISAELSTTIMGALKTLEGIMERIKARKIKNKKELEDYFKKKTNIKTNFEILDLILKNRFKFDSMRHFLKVDEKLNKINSIF